MFLLTGLELGGVMAGEIRRPERTVALAAGISGGAIAVFYVAGTGALLAILPVASIDPVYGIAQAAAHAGAVLGAGWLPVALAAIIVVSVIGQFGAILCSTSRLPWIFGLDHYLPPVFGRIHPRFGTPDVSMFAGAIVSTLFLTGMFSGETVHAGLQHSLRRDDPAQQPPVPVPLRSRLAARLPDLFRLGFSGVVHRPCVLSRSAARNDIGS